MVYHRPLPHPLLHPLVTSLTTPLLQPLKPLTSPYSPITPRPSPPLRPPLQAAWLTSMMGEIEEQREMPQAVQREWLMRQPLSCSSTINRGTIDTIGPKAQKALRAALERGDALGACSRPADPQLLAQAMEAAVVAPPRHWQPVPLSAQSPPPVSAPMRLGAHSYSI